jgi:hypothetical protein
VTTTADQQVREDDKIVGEAIEQIERLARAVGVLPRR